MAPVPNTSSTFEEHWIVWDHGQWWICGQFGQGIDSDMDTLCRNIDPSLVTTSDYSHGGPSRYTSVGDGGENVAAMLSWWRGCAGSADVTRLLFDIDAKLILIHTKSREGINIQHQYPCLQTCVHIKTCQKLSKALFWLLALLSEDLCGQAFEI